MESGKPRYLAPDQGASASLDPGSVRGELNDEIRLWRPNGKAVNERIAAAVEQVPKEQCVLHILLESEFDPGVGALSVVILLEDFARGILQDQDGVQGRSKSLGRDFADERLGLSGFKLESIDIPGAPNPAINDHRHGHGVSLGGRVVGLSL